MYARLTLINLGPGTRSTADALVENFKPALAARDGVKSVYFIGDDESGKYGSIVLWDSKEAAEASNSR